MLLPQPVSTWHGLEITVRSMMVCKATRKRPPLLSSNEGL